ncbi:MAG TPA: transposase [Ktedonobacteraceae bacterium]|nr:transposase [Ktedonobacteraceae bacterium]
MKLVAQIKLQPSAQQRDLLKATLERANAACNAINDYAWVHKTFSQYPLHKALYYDIKGQFELTAQMVVRCLSKVADAYKKDHDSKCNFSKYGSIAYDERILSYYTQKGVVSIWTLAGRQQIPYVCGKRAKGLLLNQKGESDLLYHRGEFYLLATCELSEPTPKEVDEYLGVDRGIINIATDSDGNIYQGARVERRRKRFAKQRQSLQKKGTKSAKRKLRKISGKQARFQKDVNHCTAKELVKRAKRTKRGVAIENLKGINLRTRVRRQDRDRRGNWSFAQLGDYITYKAALYGVLLRKVDPCYTSQRCAECGHVEKSNRLSQSEFLCKACGHQAHADVNAARNVSWVAVNRPIVSDTTKDRGSARGKPSALVHPCGTAGGR